MSAVNTIFKFMQPNVWYLPSDLATLTRTNPASVRTALELLARGRMIEGLVHRLGRSV